MSRRLHANELLTKTYRDDSRRVNIVISSPQRYVRPTQARQFRASGQRFWSDALPKSAHQDYLYSNGGQNFYSNSVGMTGRPLISGVRTNRLTQMDYRRFSPSPMGLQNGWSSYGGVNRDNITIGSQSGNSYDENAQLQYQQQRNLKQQNDSTNHYQTDDYSPKLSKELKMSQNSSTYFNGDTGNGEVLLDDTVSKNRRKSLSNISHEFEKQYTSDSMNRSTQQHQQQQLIDKSCPVQKADLSGSCAVSSEKGSSQIDGDKIETQVSNRSGQQQQEQQSKAKQRDQNLSGTATFVAAATDISSKSPDTRAK